MEIRQATNIFHPNYIEALFSFKAETSKIFSNVLGLHKLNHIAITQINSKEEILTFSSTPAMEFNLFNSQLWQFDKSYHPDWYKKCEHASWQSLYMSNHYDELYYLKQLKHSYAMGYSLATKFEDKFFIYSFASEDFSEQEQLLAEQSIVLYKIGFYCATLLNPLFKRFD